MEINLRRADIVILASSHNPSIIAPQWLKDNSLITEEPKHFVHTPDFSLFESEAFSLVVDHQRLQITAKKQDKSSLRSLANVARNYIELLPHIPYRALGLNFRWNVEVVKGENFPEVKLSINESDLTLLFKNHEINYGGVIYARKDPYVLKLAIEPQSENTLVHNFNYHHEVRSIPAEDIARLIDSFYIRYENSAEIVKNIYLGGRK